uniref:Uncharacterized protein n=1 Tax=viral metagenome TaxID=1070528 RepID=A0A2V0RA68_9ZZZZ
MSNTVFKRKDSKTGDRWKEWSELEDTEEARAAFRKTCVFSEADQKWWDTTEKFSSDDILSTMEVSDVSPGLLFAKSEGWDLSDWHDYAIECSADRAAVKRMMTLEAEYFRALKIKKREAKTGLTDESAAHMAKWRTSIRAMKQAELMMKNIGLALNREFNDRAHTMMSIRKQVVGPWAAYFERESEDWLEEGRKIDGLLEYRSLIKKGMLPTAARDSLMPKWRQQRETALATIAKIASRTATLGDPPPPLEFGLTANEMAALVAQFPSCPTSFTKGLPDVPEPSAYGLGSARRRSRSGSKRSRSPKTPTARKAIASPGRVKFSELKIGDVGDEDDVEGSGKEEEMSLEDEE